MLGPLLQRLPPPPPVAWMTWTCWARLCCNSPFHQSLSKSDGRKQGGEGPGVTSGRSELPGEVQAGHLPLVATACVSCLPCREKQPPPRLTLRDLQNKSGSSPSVTTNSTSPLFQSLSTTLPVPLPSEQPAPVVVSRAPPAPSAAALSTAGLPASKAPPEISLTNVTVPLESIKPSELDDSITWLGSVA